MIVKFEEELGLRTSMDQFAQEYEEDNGNEDERDPETGGDDEEQPQDVHLPAGQIFRNRLMTQVVHHIEQSL